MLKCFFFSILLTNVEFHIPKRRLRYSFIQIPHFKQNITRDIEVKNNLTIARGEGEGRVERGVFRNYSKGHMDKIKGEVEAGERGGFGWGGVEGWGESADNCN